MRIERLPGDKETHDFARTFENHVDAAITQQTFHRHRLLTAPGERVRCFIAASSAYLHRLIGNAPGRFSGPHFAHGGFDAQVACFPIDQSRREKRHRFHGEHIACHLRDFARNRRVFADRDTPLNPFARPFPADL